MRSRFVDLVATILVTPFRSVLSSWLGLAPPMPADAGELHRATRVEVKIADNGVEFPGELNFRRASTFGLQLVWTPVDQPGGKIELLPGEGTCFQILFPMWRDEAEAVA